MICVFASETCKPACVPKHQNNANLPKGRHLNGVASLDLLVVQAAEAAALPEGKQVDDNAAIWANPAYNTLAGGAIIGAKPAQPAGRAVAQAV